MPVELATKGRSPPLSCQLTQVKLPYANAVHELDASNCRDAGNEAFQTHDWLWPRLHIAMVLLDQIIQVL